MIDGDDIVISGNHDATGWPAASEPLRDNIGNPAPMTSPPSSPLPRLWAVGHKSLVWFIVAESHDAALYSLGWKDNVLQFSRTEWDAAYPGCPVPEGAVVPLQVGSCAT